MSREPDAGAHWFRAPGRVNLIGDHTDYNDGFVLPLAIDRGCTVGCIPRLDRPGPLARRRRETVDLPPDGSADPAAVEPGWGRYVAGVVRELAVRGRPPAGMDALVTSDLPIGSGLSSSAALEVACALALVDAADWQIEPAALAEALPRRGGGRGRRSVRDHGSAGVDRGPCRRGTPDRLQVTGGRHRCR